jgi:hypothetical protein
MGWRGHVSRIGEMRGADRLLVDNVSAKDHLEDLGYKIKVM